MRPLEIAQRVFGALGEGASYEAQLALDFGEAGRLGLDAQLGEMAQSAPDGVLPRAQFDKVGGGDR